MPATRRPIRIALSLLFLGIVVSDAALAPAAGREVTRFYKDKGQSTSRAAFERAERRLDAVKVGMSELRFLEVMQLAVLAHRGKAVDALLDGYLADASLKANRDEPGLRHVVLGYVEQDREQSRAVVVLVDRRVVEVRRLPAPQVARGDAASGP